MASPYSEVQIAPPWQTSCKITSVGMTPVMNPQVCLNKKFVPHLTQCPTDEREDEDFDLEFNGNTINREQTVVTVQCMQV